LFIKVTDTYLFVVVLELNKPIQDQLDKIMAKFKTHNMHFSKEELRQKLTWNNKGVPWDKEFSYFLEFNESASFGKVATMFSFFGTNSDRPVYKSDPYSESVNLKMKCGDIIEHFYTLGQEEYQKQEFDINTTTSASIIGFDISQFSTKFDFCKNFKLIPNLIEKSLEEANEDASFYRRFAILLKRATSGGSLLFVYNQENKEWISVETQKTMSLEDMKSQFVKMVWFMNDPTLEEEEDEEIEVGAMEV